MPSNTAHAAAQIKQSGVVAIIRGDYALNELLTIAETLLNASVTTLEVTLNSRGALEAIAALRQHFGQNMLVGAGTVRTADQLDQAFKVGAQFIVSPNFDPASAIHAKLHDVLHLPGVATATEAQNAFLAGCAIVKLFPANLLGGPAYLKALRAPLNDIEFAPTGGITADNLVDYVQAGAVAVGVGSWLVPAANWSTAEIAARANALSAAWKDAHHA
ncbi:MAG: bifunctional 4-hydroxy-2-oxoglutarate aldolase/2-dehydro-3-deoxy-phosphogluconate aldolase [Chloroflexota bacterium]